MVDIAQNLYLERHGRELGDGASMGVRLAIWGASIVTSIVVYDSLQYVTALIGINSMLISVLLPIGFYVVLHRAKMGLAETAAYAFLVLVSVAITVVITCVDVQEFLESLSSMSP